jgi:hypothetical protein
LNVSPLLLLHIGSGIVGLLAGTVAIVVRKGSCGHGNAGIAFSVSMLTLGATGAYIAYTLSQTGNLLGGILTTYMVATAWIAGRRRDGGTSALDWVTLFVALGVGTACVLYGLQAIRGASVAQDGVPAGMNFFLGFILLLAAVGDVRMIQHGGVVGKQRIARHLWRMCFGLCIASGSFFMGASASSRNSSAYPPYFSVSTFCPLILLAFSMIRIRRTGAYARVSRHPETVRNHSQIANPSDLAVDSLL